MSDRPENLDSRYLQHRWRKKLGDSWLSFKRRRPGRFTKRDETLVKESGMFNAEWYARGGRGGSIRHYLLHGVSEGRDPHPLFSTRFYLERYPDVAASGIDPLVHYLTRGAVEGRDPHPLFSARFYLGRNPDVAEAGLNPLIHYLSYGAAEGRDPHPWFNGRHYRSRTPDAASPGINPLWHYLSCGVYEVGDPHPCFANRFYHDQNPDVGASRLNTLVHYLTIGISEGRLPCPGDGSHVTMEEPATRSGIEGDRMPFGDSIVDWRKRVLIIDDCDTKAPSSPGGRLTSRIVKNFHSLGFGVGFLPSNMTMDPDYRKELVDMGTTVVAPVRHCTTATDYLAAYGCDYGIFYLRDIDSTDELLYFIRASAPGATVIFHPSTWRDSIGTAKPESRQREANGTVAGKNLSSKLSVAARADVVVASSSSDVTDLQAVIPEGRTGYYSVLSSHDTNSVLDRDVDARAEFPSLISVLSEAKLLPLEAWQDYCTTIAPLPLPQIAAAAAVDVSIVIPVFSQWQITKRCLNSILQTTPIGDVVVEVILADDRSSDDALHAAKQFPGARIVRSETSTGYVEACSSAARQAHGRYLLFVDCNAVPLAGWLTNLVSTAERDDSVAIVGSKLLTPDGRIRGGGSTIFRDGTMLDIGRGADRHVPIMNEAREVDYVSSQSVLIRRSFWEQAGGLDGRYAEADYMDADLGMTARQMGYRVVYQPASEIVVPERSTGFRSPIWDKWHKTLAKGHMPPVSWPLAMSGAERSRVPSARPRRMTDAYNVLYFSPIPTHPVAHGNRANVLRFAKWIQQAGHKVHFVLLQSNDYSEDDAKEMATNWDTFDVVAFAKSAMPSGTDLPFDGAYEEGLGERIRSLCFKYDIDVVICSYVCHSKLLEFIPAHILKVIDTHDKMGNRYDMLRANGLPLEFFSCTPEEEGAYLRRADIVIARREEEARYFDEVSGCQSAIVVPYFEPASFVDKAWESAKHVGIVASANNINLRMVHECIGAIDQKLNGSPCPFVLHVVGQVKEIIARLPEDQQRQFDRPWVDMIGFIEDIGTFYKSMDLILSPVTVGTGINVKTVQAMAFGMPLLATTCASKGIESGDPMHSHADMTDLVTGLFEIAERPGELRPLSEVSKSTYLQFHDEAEMNMRSIFWHEKLRPSKIADKIVASVEGVPAHHGGILMADTLRRIEQLIGSSFERTLETGCGISTVFFSITSREHYCFTLDDRMDSNSSLNFVDQNPLFDRTKCHYVLGPTQKTMPAYSFTKQFDVVFIDGPHGFPFPELEYFFAYPHIKEGGYLIVNDVQIPSIARLADILADDEMFELVETVVTTAVFRRTGAPAFDREGDSWWLQRYNRHRVSPKRAGIFLPRGQPRVPFSSMRLDNELMDGRLKARLGLPPVMK
jgi:GT2 family glycosyltransferase